MCGIAGIVDLKAAREIDRDALKRMTDALAHRGPDGEGYFIEPGVGFGHRRLAVIDKQGGVQPFHTQVRNCVLSFNGEIYNYRALSSEIGSTVSLKTRSDTEVLAEGLAQRGPKFIHDLRGMFAFAFWEPDARRLTLARDRLGEKPLYYAVTEDGFLLFASEFGALMASGLAETEIDLHAFSDYCYYGYIPDPKTIYAGVKKLAPGHTLTAESGEMRLDRYWRPIVAERSEPSFDLAAAELIEKLDEAVALEMIADVPVGAFLSGGVDSSGIVASMAQTGKDLVTCCVGFYEPGNDERSFAHVVAEKYHTRHYNHVADVEDTSLIDTIAASFGEPFADSSALPSWLVAKLMREHVTVALSGDGGDEVFAGYRRFPFHLAEERVRRAAPLIARRTFFGPAGMLYPKLDWGPQLLRFKTTFQSLAQTTADGYAAAVAINLPLRVQAMMSADVRRDLDGYQPQSVIADAMEEADNADALARAQYADLMTWLPGRMLTKIDRTSMAHSLEVRPPLLDYKFVEWANALPSEFKLKGVAGKRVLKKALEPRLGKEFLSRKKQGFDAPIAAWMRRNDHNPAHRLNGSRLWRESGLFNEAAVDRMARAHQRGATSCAQELWTVIMFDAFLRNARRIANSHSAYRPAASR